MYSLLLLGVLSFLQDSIGCPACCGPSPCCSTCGIDLLSLLKPLLGTQVEGNVVPEKRQSVSDLFPDLFSDNTGLDHLGHLGGLFGHLTTAEPQSPEKEETYQGDQDPLGLQHVHPDPDLGHLGGLLPDPDLEYIGGLLPDIELTKPYWELIGKKK